MNKETLSNISKEIKTMLTRYNSEIMIGIGLTGMITTTVLAVRATPKALTLIDRRKKELDTDKLSVIDTIKTTWICYIPSVAIGALSACCIISANTINVRRNAALAAAYTITESTLKEYQQKIVETLGEKKDQSVRDSIAKDRIDRDPVSNREVIITEKGNTLCYDGMSGRYFKSDIDKLKKAENELNRQMRDVMYISLNEFYYEIGLDPIGVGEDIGWNIDHGYIELKFSSQLCKDGTPCLVMDYRITPKHKYNR